MSLLPRFHRPGSRPGGPGVGLRLRAPSALALALAACAPALELPGAAASSRARNLLLVVVDTLRADHVGAHGYARDTSPELDALARRGVLFTQAIAQSSWTRASMASVMTGLYPTTVGLTCHNFRLPKADCDVLSPAVETLAERLAAEGLHTAGVVANINVDPVFGFDQGFEEYFVVPAHLAASDPSWRLKNEWLHATTHEVTQTALGWLERRQRDERGFLLYLHYLDPHDPYEPPASHAAPFQAASYDLDLPLADEMARYDGEIHAVDEGLGRVLDRLDQLGLADTTAVVVISDHGEEFGDHGSVRHGFTLYDEQLRVPLIMVLPGLTRAGMHVTQQVRLLDLFPTLLDALGCAPAEDVEGRSLLPLLQGNDLDLPPALAEWGYTPLAAWRAPPWKLIHDTVGGGTLLFRLDRDPGEKLDVSSDHPGVVARLLHELRTTRAKARERRSWSRVPGETVQLSEDQLEQLRALGYLGDAND